MNDSNEDTARSPSPREPLDREMSAALAARAADPASGLIATRRILDGIVRSSTVELFRDFGLAIAPLERWQATGDQCRYHASVAVIDFESRSLAGTLTLSLSSAVLPLIEELRGNPASRSDCVRELTNQLMGRIQSRLMRHQVTLDCGLPSTINGAVLASQRNCAAARRIYVFRPFRGEIVVIFDAPLEGTVLVYSSAISIPTEGETIWF